MVFSKEKEQRLLEEKSSSQARKSVQNTINFAKE